MVLLCSAAEAALLAASLQAMGRQWAWMGTHVGWASDQEPRPHPSYIGLWLSQLPRWPSYHPHLLHLEGGVRFPTGGRMWITTCRSERGVRVTLFIVVH